MITFLITVDDKQALAKAVDNEHVAPFQAAFHRDTNYTRWCAYSFPHMNKSAVLHDEAAQVGGGRGVRGRVWRCRQAVQDARGGAMTAAAPPACSNLCDAHSTSRM